MTTTEFWWEFDAKVVEGRRLKEMTGKTSKKGFTEAEWAAARKKFSEKQRDNEL